MQGFKESGRLEFGGTFGIFFREGRQEPLGESKIFWRFRG
jgi:hypothetical protein